MVKNGNLEKFKKNKNICCIISLTKKVGMAFIGCSGCWVVTHDKNGDPREIYFRTQG